MRAAATQKLREGGRQGARQRRPRGGRAAQRSARRGAEPPGYDGLRVLSRAERRSQRASPFFHSDFAFPGFLFFAFLIIFFFSSYCVLVFFSFFAFCFCVFIIIFEDFPPRFFSSIISFFHLPHRRLLLISPHTSFLVVFFFFSSPGTPPSPPSFFSPVLCPGAAPLPRLPRPHGSLSPPLCPPPMPSPLGAPHPLRRRLPPWCGPAAGRALRAAPGAAAPGAEAADGR